MRLKTARHSVPFLVVGILCLSGGLWLAWNHPLAPAWVLAACLLAAALSAGVAHVWLLLLPGLLPVVDLAPWTGWLSFEEFDILVLATAAGTYLRQGWRRESQPGRQSLALWLLAGGFIVSAGIALVRGFLDAGGFDFGWFQGYGGAMNSLRLVKSLVLASLFIPFMKPAVMRPGAPGIRMLAWGLALGLALASLAAIWERVAFPGLLNFSQDYRTTALFWEMHVGGAAFDGFLALTMPFALWLAFRERRSLMPAALVVCLGGYAALTTFSRGVYGALLVVVLVLAGLVLRQSATQDKFPERVSPRNLILGLVAVLGAVFGAYGSFLHGGYRTLAAVYGVLVLMVLSAAAVRGGSTGQRGAGVVLGVIGGLAAAGLAMLVAKGAYLAYGALFLLAMAAMLRDRQRPVSPILVLAGPLATAMAAALVAWHWGGGEALTEVLAVLAGILVVAAWHARAGQPVLPTTAAGQGALLVGVAALAALVAIFSGGAYMGKRFSQTEGDVKGRLEHWHNGLALLQSPMDWLVGKGLGRFPENFFFGAPGNEFPGSYQLRRDGDNSYLALSGPRYEIGWGEVLRVSQRMPLVSGMYRLEFDSRSDRKAKLILGVCEKHLLYRGACAGTYWDVGGNDTGGWSHQVINLDARSMTAGPWYAPRLVVFNIALESLGARVDLDNLQLFDNTGRQVLANGDFSREMARWFITSDHHHLPWHMKNMFLHVLFEQGGLGLILFFGWLGVALGRLSVGRNRAHPLAPPMAAALAGFVVVGLFDSLIDVPRVAFLFFLLLFMAIQASRRKA